MSGSLINLLNQEKLSSALSIDTQNSIVNDLQKIGVNLDIFKGSITSTQKSILFLAKGNQAKCLGVISKNDAVLPLFEGTTNRLSIEKDRFELKICPLNQTNGNSFRKVLPHFSARTFGLRKSAGFGDRLGLATPGHLQSVSKTSIAPILAQQSVRENERTGRTPQIVFDDAMWGAFQFGWHDGFGADADHLKAIDDLNDFIKAGYSFFTIDPGEYVDNSAGILSQKELQSKLTATLWEILETSQTDLLNRLAERSIKFEEFFLTFSAEEIMRAAVKYGYVVAHTVKMYRSLCDQMEGKEFDLEISVDETDSPTTFAEHFYLVSELKRLGVKWVSLAPRFVGHFEKGVDYIGDLDKFRAEFAVHAAISKKFGPYKLSLHSGSDKFSIYPITSALAGDLVHLKTAGTSYLEALRTIASEHPDLFKEIYQYAVNRYEEDKVSYHVSAQLSELPAVNRVVKENIAEIFANFHVREVLHVTFGSVLNHSTLATPFFETLKQNEAKYAKFLEIHFDRHLESFK